MTDAATLTSNGRLRPHLSVLLMTMAIALVIGTAGCTGAQPMNPPHSDEKHAAEPSEHGGNHGHAGHHEHRFESAEEWAERFDDPERDAWQQPDEVVRMMQLEPGQRVADLGAGTGYFLPHLSHAVGDGGEVLGLDIEPSMVEYMRARAEREGLANVVAQQVEAGDLGLKDASLDAILIVNTWHHIPDRKAYGATLHRVLRSGGVLTIVDFDLDTEHGPPAEYKLAPEQVVEELTAGGLVAQPLDETLPRQYVIRAIRP